MNIKLPALFIGCFFLATSLTAFSSTIIERPAKDSLAEPSKTILQREQFNKGSFMSFEDLLYGKFPGLLITPKNGAPGKQSRMSLRGLSSVEENTNPLIVINGLPLLYSESITIYNIMTIINPNDIKSIEILKDISAASIYGIDARHGAIIIKTESGYKKNNDLKIRFSSIGSISNRSNKVDMMSSTAYRNLILNEYPERENLLNSSNTDWQNVIDQTGFGTDQHLSVKANVSNTPINLSLGYTKRNGVIKTIDFERKSIHFNTSKQLFDKNLKIDFGFNSSNIDSSSEHPYVFEHAFIRNPTAPVYDDNGKYYTGDIYASHPLALLEQIDRVSNTKMTRFNFGASYKLHFFPNLKLKVAYQQQSIEGSWSRNDYEFMKDSEYYNYYTSNFYSNEQKNKMSTFGVEYSKDLSELKSIIRIGLNYEIVNFEQDDFQTEKRLEFSEHNNDPYSEGSLSRFEKNIERKATYVYLAYSFMNKLFINANYRNEKSKMSFIYSDSFNEKSKNLQLKYALGNVVWKELDFMNVYASWGKTGDCDSDIKDRSTFENQSSSYGINFSVLNNSLYSKVEYFKKRYDKHEVSNLLDPSGTLIDYHELNFSVENMGWEITLLGTIFKNKAYQWDLGFNLTTVTNELKDLGDYNQYLYNKSQIHKIGEPLYTFYNGENTVGSALPDMYWGFESNFRYKNWTLSLNLRGNYGSYTYNLVDKKHAESPVYTNDNISREFYNIKDNPEDLNKSHFFKRSSFIHLENISLTYHVDRLFSKKIRAKFFIVGQNLKTWTTYKGLNPDTQDGIDYDNYPRPKTYTIGVELNF